MVLVYVGHFRDMLKSSLDEFSNDLFLLANAKVVIIYTYKYVGSLLQGSLMICLVMIPP